MRRLKLLAPLTIVTVFLGFYLLSRLPGGTQSEAAQTPTPKYIFIFLADGAGVTHLEIARMYSRHIHNEELVISDKIMREGTLGLLTTHSADSLSSDSAAAATALACGCKAKIGMLGMCEDASVPKSVLELAKERNMRIGLVTNSTIYDASPAAFASHLDNRKLYSSIIKQYLKLEPNLLLGGGRDQFLPKGHVGSRRTDDVDEIASFRKRGYTYVSDKQGLSQVKGAKLLGLFSLRDMSFEIDRDKNIEPSVYDMTQAAIRILQEGNQRGFVVFIETENVDSAAHLTDIASIIHDFREFDRAVGLAYEFYKKHPQETLILVTSDHETGGLGFTMAMKEMGNRKSPTAATVQDLKKIQSIPISLKKAVEILGPNPTSESLDKLMADYFKEFFLAPDLKNAILSKGPIGRSIYLNPVANGLGMMIANNTQAYWGTTSHTNHPVFVAALGVGAENFRGYQDNTDFAKHLFTLLKEKL
ncbi:MAG: alkaline phosphatase [Deltaproteobacteria bacterium]|nr:alkaline phosphatase [Deltaproteobacteria bacterium]